MAKGVEGLANPEGLISRALWQAQHAVEQACDSALASLGMTTTLVGALTFLAQEPGQSTADLARLSRVAPQSVAKAVTRLDQLGLIRRQAHPVHGRIVQLYLTTAGRKLLANATVILRQFEDDLCGGLDDRGRRDLLTQLNRLRERAAHLRATQPG